MSGSETKAKRFDLKPVRIDLARANQMLKSAEPSARMQAIISAAVPPRRTARTNLLDRRRDSGTEQVWLESAHPDYPPRAITTETDLVILGVVTHVVHAF